MMKEPWFWREKTIAARLIAGSLAPGAMLYGGVQRLSVAMTKAAPAPLPVLCIGNATLGGVGKTPFALMLQRLLKTHDVNAHFLTRGYGGALKGPVLVDLSVHDAGDVGDEALLLASSAPCWVSRNRPAGAKAAKEGRADAVIMDDGFQNPSLEKTLSFLLTDAEDPVGNGKLFPAGPLREREAEARARADAIVFVLKEKNAPRPEALSELPAFHVWLEASGEISPKRVIAFCGVARPKRFFASLAAAGYDVVDAIAYPDHHPYDEAAMKRLRRLAKEHGASLVTTEKDLVRLHPSLREDVEVFPVAMKCDRPEALTSLALSAIRGFGARGD